ncbi:MAG: hypothetical protein J5687_05665 [Treponema sp.]|nr:hypothetical protein [Treponema sp.]
MNGEMDELDEKEREKRKNDQIEYRKKQKASNTFLFLGTICEVILCFGFVFVFFIISILIVAKVPESAQQIVYNILMIISFLGGLVSGFFVYRTLGRLVIKKMNLKEKLREDVLNQFKTRKEFKTDYEKKKNR